MENLKIIAKILLILSAIQIAQSTDLTFYIQNYKLYATFDQNIKREKGIEYVPYKMKSDIT